MCGRYVSPDEAGLEREFHIGRHYSVQFFLKAFEPSFNVCLSQDVPAICGGAMASTSWWRCAGA
jgi:hypothetical protein